MCDDRRELLVEAVKCVVRELQVFVRDSLPCNFSDVRVDVRGDPFIGVHVHATKEGWVVLRGCRIGNGGVIVSLSLDDFSLDGLFGVLDGLLKARDCWKDEFRVFRRRCIDLLGCPWDDE